MSIDDKIKAPPDITYLGKVKDYKVYIDMKRDIMYKRLNDGEYIRMFIGGKNGV